jgi:pimeloyl-ACP methyl ester carboxylesterase
VTEPKRITANGVDFAYLEAGPPDGPLALCLHGFPDHAPTWEALLPQLADAGFHAVAPWMRGYAPTQVPSDGRYHTSVLGLDAIAIADALAPDRDLYLVGHDWGASAVYAAAGFRPSRLKKVVAMSLAPPQSMGRFLFEPEQLQRSFYIFFFQTPFAEMAVEANDYAFIDKLWRDWCAGPGPSEAFMRALKDTFSSPGSLAAAIGYYKTAFAGPAEGTPTPEPTVDVPALYLQGAEDLALLPKLIDESAFSSFFTAGYQFDMVPAAGHFVHIDQPDVVLPRIVSYLTS